MHLSYMFSNEVYTPGDSMCVCKRYVAFAKIPTSQTRLPNPHLVLYNIKIYMNAQRDVHVYL